MDNGYLTLGPFLSEYCEGKTGKLSGVFVIDDFQSKKEEFARMGRPVDFISSNYKNLLSDEDYLEESGAGYEISADKLKSDYDKGYHISMCYPMIDDPDTLARIDSLKGNPDEYRKSALRSADDYVIILSKNEQAPSIDVAAPKPEGDIDGNQINSTISGYLICDYVVFSSPAALADEKGISATGMALPIGIVETRAKAEEIASKRKSQFTSILEVSAGQVVIESTALYFTDASGVMRQVSAKKGE